MMDEPCFNTLRTLVLASAMTGAFKVDTGFNLKKFWLRSFRVASIARTLAKQSKLDADAAFTCGMMHNIGELLREGAMPLSILERRIKERMA